MDRTPLAGRAEVPGKRLATITRKCRRNTSKILFCCIPVGIKHGPSTSLNHPLSLLLSNTFFMYWMKHRMPLSWGEAFGASPMIRWLFTLISESLLDDTPGFKPDGTRPERTGSDRSLLLYTSSTFHTSSTSFLPAMERACSYQSVPVRTVEGQKAPLPPLTHLLCLIPMEVVWSGPYQSVPVQAICKQNLLLSAHADSNRCISTEKA